MQDVQSLASSLWFKNKGVLKFNNSFKASRMIFQLLLCYYFALGDTIVLDHIIVFIIFCFCQNIEVDILNTVKNLVVYVDDASQFIK